MVVVVVGRGGEKGRWGRWGGCGGRKETATGTQHMAAVHRWVEQTATAMTRGVEGGGLGVVGNGRKIRKYLGEQSCWRTTMCVEDCGLDDGVLIAGKMVARLVSQLCLHCRLLAGQSLRPFLLQIIYSSLSLSLLLSPSIPSTHSPTFLILKTRL